ncbi:hypothetical protein [Mesorhizobium sp. B4-1-3]|uniref:hypothetical protein n=1 Tax=Mesorhizobium sp. B4-1-3 TaxID=2589889 RepID=UPI0015E290B3|nr:hypothetical protein [Mesorhizobium sp. B4-1-3]
MPADGKSPQDGILERLVREIGITETQALELVALLGRNWSSLVREAKNLLAKN